MRRRGSGYVGRLVRGRRLRRRWVEHGLTVGPGSLRGRGGGRCYTPVHLSARSWRPASIVTPTAASMADGAAGRPLRALSATPALILLLLGGLALRLAIAYVLFPGSGFGSDLGTYTSWSLTMAEHGPAGFYG